MIRAMHFQLVKQQAKLVDVYKRQILLLFAGNIVHMVQYNRCSSYAYSTDIFGLSLIHI